MKIHTNALNDAYLYSLMQKASKRAPDVDLHILGMAGSRSHTRAIEIALRGHGKRHTRPPNTGITGAASGERAATIDDWGHFLAQVFASDPSAKAGPYKNANDFHRATSGKYNII
jgi:hypothetical protein